MGFMNRFLTQPYRNAVSPDSTTRFATSWILPPLYLFIWRAAVSLYAFVVLLTILGIYSTNNRTQAAHETFSYFTVLGYWGLAFYFGFAALHSGSAWMRGRAFLEDWPSGLRWAHSIFYTTITVFPFVVTVFWGALSYGAFYSQFSTWSNISEHALNSVFALSEIILPATRPHPWINVFVLIVLLAMYLGLAYLTVHTEGFYVYEFLDPDNGSGLVAGACIGILAATVVLFAIVHWLIKLRVWVTETKLGMGIKTGGRRNTMSTVGGASEGSVEMSGISAKAGEV